MPRYMFGTNDPVEAGQIMALLAGGGGPAIPNRPTALPPQMPGGQMPVPSGPPMPGSTPTPPPPPQPAAPPVSANPRLDNVIRLMDGYAKGGTPPNGVAGVRAVLTVLGLSRAQDANEEQLVWLEQAFANPAWKPN